MKQCLIALVMLFGAAFALAESYPEGLDSELIRFYPQDPQELQHPVRIFAHFSVSEPGEVSGFYYSELFPNWIRVRPDMVTVNGLLADCIYEIGLPDELMEGHSSYRWVLDDPAIEGGRVLAQGDQVLVTYIIYASSSGTLNAIHDGWSGRMQLVEQEGVFGYDSHPMEIQFGDLVDSPQTPPVNLELRPAFPNPFNPSTRISFVTDRDRDLRLEIFDVQGRLVRTLLADRFTAGTHSVRWNGADEAGGVLASGVYMARLTSTEGWSQGQKLLLLK